MINETKDMTLNEAIRIVLELAEQNLIDDPDMTDERERQEAAIEKVERFLVCSNDEG